ncbi:MAG: SHOCT domain-containing protein [Deltaproteobacteria bacterium]|nr:SHOCT domain-containing protein [Deltaproteobacteria bacterium]
MDPYHYHYFGMHFVWWIFWLMLLAPFLFFVTPVRRSTAQRYRENPFGILQRRYAAGEITTEEYEDRKARIERDWREPGGGPGSAVPRGPSVPV